MVASATKYADVAIVTIVALYDGTRVAAVAVGVKRVAALVGVHLDDSDRLNALELPTTCAREEPALVITRSSRVPAVEQRREFVGYLVMFYHGCQEGLRRHEVLTVLKYDQLHDPSLVTTVRSWTQRSNLAPHERDGHGAIVEEDSVEPSRSGRLELKAGFLRHQLIERLWIPIIYVREARQADASHSFRRTVLEGALERLDRCVRSKHLSINDGAGLLDRGRIMVLEHRN